MYSITELRRSQCRFPLTDDKPFVFCGEPVRDALVSYCPAHCKACFTGQLGKAWQGLAGMIDATEQGVSYQRPTDDRQADVVEECNETPGAPLRQTFKVGRARGLVQNNSAITGHWALRFSGAAFVSWGRN